MDSHTTSGLETIGKALCDTLADCAAFYTDAAVSNPNDGVANQKIFFTSNTQGVTTNAAYNAFVKDGSSATTSTIAATDSMRFTSTGGSLHGTWLTDVELSASDRKLKENIRPIHETLEAANTEALMRSGQLAANSGGALNKMLRELRPVSYMYRKDDVESKHMRFGFIADEMQNVLPEVTRTLDTEDKRQSIVYQDLIAVLTAMIQGVVKDFAALAPRMHSVETRIAQRKKWKQQQQQSAQDWTRVGDTALGIGGHAAASATPMSVLSVVL